MHVDYVGIDEPNRFRNPLAREEVSARATNAELD
jgi:hypothetical protein